MDRALASLSPQLASGLSGAETYGQRQHRILFSNQALNNQNFCGYSIAAQHFCEDDDF